jgi:hypothetical protein
MITVNSKKSTAISNVKTPASYVGVTPASYNGVFDSAV